MDSRDPRQPALERLAAYILRPSFAGTRLQYEAETGQIEYRTTQGTTRSLDALDWIALVTSHIPDPHQQTVRYYGRYSNSSRGKRRKQALGVSVTSAAGSPPEPDSPAEHYARQRRRTLAICSFVRWAFSPPRLGTVQFSLSGRERQLTS